MQENSDGQVKIVDAAQSHRYTTAMKTQTDIPIPEKTGGRALRWDFGSMTKGASFTEPKAQASNLTSAASRYKSTRTGWDYTTKTEGDVIRLWCTAVSEPQADEVEELRIEVRTLTDRCAELEAENAELRSLPTADEAAGWWKPEADKLERAANRPTQSSPPPVGSLQKGKR